MTENDLVKKIIANANKEARQLLEDAETASMEAQAAASNAANERKKTAISAAEKKLKQRGTELTLAVEVDNIKKKINAKAEIMARVFDGIRENILSSPQKQKLADALAKKYGKPDDKVTVAADGGIMISGKTYDIDLSLSVLLDDLREAIESDIAKMLF